MMKAILIQTAILWLAIVAEQARPDLIPAYALLLPMSAMILIANKSTMNILMVGVAFLLQDLLRMQTLPLVTVGVLVAGTFVVTRPESDPLSRRSGSRRRRVVPKWFLQSSIIVSSGILLYFSQQAYQQNFEIKNLQTHLIVSIPVFLLSAMVLRISREFGFRFAID